MLLSRIISKQSRLFCRKLLQLDRAKETGRPSTLYTRTSAADWPVPQTRTLLKCTVTYVLLTALKKSAAVMPILTGLQMMRKT